MISRVCICDLNIKGNNSIFHQRKEILYSKFQWFIHIQAHLTIENSFNQNWRFISLLSQERNERVSFSALFSRKCEIILSNRWWTLPECMQIIDKMCLVGIKGSVMPNVCYFSLFSRCIEFQMLINYYTHGKDSSPMAFIENLAPNAWESSAEINQKYKYFTGLFMHERRKEWLLKIL